MLSCRWAATLGIVLAISRGFIAEQGMAFEPELALLEVVAHTHWLPRHWRGRGHTREVQEQFQQLFQFKVWRIHCYDCLMQVCCGGKASLALSSIHGYCLSCRCVVLLL